MIKLLCDRHPACYPFPNLRQRTWGSREIESSQNKQNKFLYLYRHPRHGIQHDVQFAQFQIPTDRSDEHWDTNNPSPRESHSDSVQKCHTERSRVGDTFYFWMRYIYQLASFYFWIIIEILIHCAGTKLKTSSVTTALAAQIYHRFFEAASESNYDPYVCTVAFTFFHSPMTDHLACHWSSSLGQLHSTLPASSRMTQLKFVISSMWYTGRWTVKQTSSI